MDLASIVDDEFIQPLRGAIVGDDLIATGQLIDSVGIINESTETREQISVVAMSYILQLRDGEQYKTPPSFEDIKTWLEAKGLDSVLDAGAVLASIKSTGTTWDKKGGSEKLQSVINKENVKRILAIAVSEHTNKILSTAWQSR